MRLIFKACHCTLTLNHVNFLGTAPSLPKAIAAPVPTLNGGKIYGQHGDGQGQYNVILSLTQPHIPTHTVP